ncbi:MAG: caspase family protein, partial [Pseudomonadota bacterium]
MSDRYAVLIGSSQFPEEERLQDLLCPEQDVDDLHGLLSDSEHGGFSETHLLKNRPHHEVLRTLNRVLKKAAKDDLVLIYYSGHGKL